MAPRLRSGQLRALSLSSAGVRHQWHAVYLNDLASVAYVREFLAIAARVFATPRRRPSPPR